MTRRIDLQALRAGVVGGDRRSLARAITLVESGRPGGRELIKTLPAGQRAYVVGLTGPPGAGKSTLAFRLASQLHDDGVRVAVLAVDPTSPFTGGAILGDRIRMEDSARTGDVFVRSMASRGQAGGLARAAADALRLMAAAGHELILVETVGAGQGEVDIMRHADTTVVVLVPNLGDDIQAIKAGILEIGDLFCVNKSDLADADRLVRQLEMMLDLKPDDDGYRPPIVQVVAREGIGIDRLLEGIAGHRRYLEKTGRDEARRLAAAGAELKAVLAECLVTELLMNDEAADWWRQAVNRLALEGSDPYSEVETIMGYYRADPTNDQGGANRDDIRCQRRPDG